MANNNTMSIDPSLKGKNRIIIIIKHQINQTGANGLAKRRRNKIKSRYINQKRTHASIKTHARALDQRSVEPYIVN